MEQTKKLYSAIMIDDEIWALRGLEGIIDWKENGFQIIGTFTDSRQALDAIISHQPDVIFTDIRMPDVDGVELIRQVNTLNMSTRIVIVSAYEDFEIARMALKSNVTDYLIKPLDRDEVRKTAQTVYAQLSASRRTSFHITDYDLSDEANIRLPEVSRFLLSIPLSEMRVIVSDRDITADNLIPIYIKGYPFSYLLRGTIQQPVGVSSLGIGISTRIHAPEDLPERVSEAQMSYLGDFSFSENDRTMQIQKYIYENMDKKLSIETIAGHFYLSKSYVFELFRNYTDTSANNFLKNVRLTRAASYLSDGKTSIQEVAELVGYDDPGYFSKQFKSKYGCTPERYAAKSKLN